MDDPGGDISRDLAVDHSFDVGGDNGRNLGIDNRADTRDDLDADNLEAALEQFRGIAKGLEG